MTPNEANFIRDKVFMAYGSNCNAYSKRVEANPVDWETFKHQLKDLFKLSIEETRMLYEEIEKQIDKPNKNEIKTKEVVGVQENLTEEPEYEN